MEANSDFYTVGGNSFIAYASNYASSNTLSSTSLCEFDGSRFTPIVADFLVTGIPQIATTSTTEIKIYSTNCEQITSINVGSTIQAMPVTFNSNGNDRKEIYVLTSTELKTYEYNDLSAEFEQINSIDYSSKYPALNYITCQNTLDRPVSCQAFKNGTDDVVIFNITTDEVYTKNGTLSKNFAGNGQYSGVSNSRTTSNTAFRTVICSLRDGTTTSYCDLLDENGNISLTFGTNAWANTVTNNLYSSSFIAKVGNVFRIFRTEKLTTSVSSPQIFAQVYDMSGTLLWSIKASGVDYGMSNFMIGDYDKDGSNEACIIIPNATAMFYCYNSIMEQETALPITDLNLTSDLLVGASMLDFNKTKSTLGIATVEGVYYSDGTNLTKQIYTGYSYSSSRNGYTINTFTNLDADVGVIYCDNSLCYVLQNSESGVSCGDGVCEALENSLTCPADCSVTANTLNATGNFCTSDADCYTGNCEYNICELGNFKDECLYDNQCLSGDCNNNKCSKPSYWTRIDAEKTKQYGDDTATNNFIALFFILGIAGLFIVYGDRGSKYLSIPAFFITVIFFTVIGWLSPFLMFGFIVAGLVVTALIFIMGAGGD
jgi:hypothetical protein